jgi:hypothetical protein
LADEFVSTPRLRQTHPEMKRRICHLPRDLSPEDFRSQIASRNFVEIALEN